jgi:large subunit ribosomal protein L6
MVGTGYRVKKQGQGLSISAGYSHPIEFPAPTGITLDTETETVIVVSGIDKQLVGETSAKIRAIRKPEPYKGKGIKYQGEVIRRKAGKATKAGA